MPFVYTTEYCLGRRGRIQRSYRGIQALIAIAFDLMLGFCFGLVGFAMWMIRFCFVATYRLFYGLFAVPLRVVRAVFPAQPRGVRAKPVWASMDEL